MMARAGPSRARVAQIDAVDIRIVVRLSVDQAAWFAIGCVAPSPVFGTRTITPSARDTRYSASTPLRVDDMMTALPSGAQVSPESRWWSRVNRLSRPGDEIQQKDVPAFVASRGRTRRFCHRARSGESRLAHQTASQVAASSGA